MPQFSKETFSKMEINVYEEKDLLKNHKKKIHEIFGPPTKIRRVDTEELIKYLFLMYDRRTPMKELYADVNTRKEMCAVMAGYEDVKIGRVQKIFALEDEIARKYLYSLLKHQSAMVWSALVSNTELFWQYQKELLTPLENTNNDKQKMDAMGVKGKLANEIDTILERIAKYESALFGEDEDAVEKVSPTSPESIANVLSD